MLPPTITLPVSGPTAGHPEHDWTEREIIESRSIIRRLLNPEPLTAAEREAFEFWLERTNPPISVYAKALTT